MIKKYFIQPLKAMVRPIAVVIALVAFYGFLFRVVGLKDFIQLIKDLVWPTVVVIALVAFRKPLSLFLEELGRRATKFSVFQFSVELPTASEFKPDWRVYAGSLSDLRQSTSADQLVSASAALFEQFKDDEVLDYVVMDLGMGKEWLTSRLFIFALMLERMRSLRCIVFLETSGNVRRRFLGTASPNKVRRALVQRYPWLESAFAMAYSQINGYQIMPVQGALDPKEAKKLVRLFLDNIQKPALEPGPNSSEWVPLSTPSQTPWEHAKWLDGASLERELYGVLDDSCAPTLLDAPAAKQVQAVLRRKGAFVALVEEGGRFKSLVDRQALLNQVTERLVAILDDQAPTKE